MLAIVRLASRTIPANLAKPDSRYQDLTVEPVRSIVPRKISMSYGRQTCLPQGFATFLTYLDGTQTHRLGKQMLGFQTHKYQKSLTAVFSKTICTAVVVFAFLIPVCGQGQNVDDQYRLAAGHYSRGSFEESRDAFARLAEEHPGTEKAAISYFFLGESEVQLQNYEVAYSHYQAFLTAMPEHQHTSRALFRLGECAYQLRRMTQAASLLEKFAWTYPNDPLREYALAFLGDARLQRNEPQLAQRVFETAMQSYPQSSMSQRYRYGLARAMQQQGYYDEASRFYLFLANQGEGPYLAQSLLQMGIIDFNSGLVENARSSLIQALPALSTNQEVMEANYWLARTELATENYEQAFGYLDSIADDVTEGELGAAILFDGSVAAAKTDRIDTAQRWLARLRDGWPDSRWSENAMQMQIDLATQAGDNQNALGWIEQFEKEFPESDKLPSIIEYAGRIQYENKNYQKSIEMFNRLLDRQENAVDERQTIWRYYIGLGHLGLKDYGAAYESLTKTKVGSADKPFQASLAIAKATALIGLGRNLGAAPYLQQYLDIEPNGTQSARARSELAIAFVQDGQWDQASVAMKQLRDKHEGDPLVLTTASVMAEAAYKAKKHRYSESYFELLADSGNGKYAERGLSGLAWARLQDSQSEKAMVTFERLLNEYPDSTFAPEAAMARGKYLEEREQHAPASEAFALVHTRFANSKLANTARLRQAYNLQKTGGGENLQTAKSVLLEYLKTQKSGLERGDAIYQLAWVYADLGQQQESLQRFEEISNSHKASRFWVDATYRVAKQAVSVENYTKADQLLKRLLASETPKEVESRCLFLRGQIAAKQKDWVVVGETMTELVSQTDDNQLHAKASYWLAESLYQREEYSSAVDVFGQLCRRTEITTAKLQPWIQLRYSQSLSYLERWTAALSAADSGLKTYSDFELRYEFDYIRGRALAAQGRLDDARAAYEKVTKSAEGRATETAAMAQWRIGETYFHQEEYKQAIDAYYKVDSLFAYKKWRAAALMQAGKCQEHLGNWRHAIKLYKQLVEKFPNSQYVADATQRMDLAVRQANLKQKVTR